MAVRIRVYPQHGGLGGYGGVGGYGMYGGRIAQVQLQNERKTGNLRLQYERALWQEKLKNVQLETAMQYQSAAPYAGGYGGYGYPRAISPWGGLTGAWAGGFGGLGLGGLGFGGSPLGLLGGLGGMFL